MQVQDNGILYLVATPLGNLHDISQRMRIVLADCDVVAAEDTRRTRQLLTACGIAGKRLLSVRQHNETAAATMIARQYQGAHVAYVCDAGSPGISDPGARLVSLMRDRGFTIIPIPGPSAVVAAIGVAGFEAAGYVFGGFLPRQEKAALAKLQELASINLPVVIFEAPRRVRTTLARISTAVGNTTQVCMCRELTKLHESITVGTPAQLDAELDASQIPKGEFTLVFAMQDRESAALPTASALRVARLLQAELPLTKAAKLAAKITGADARSLYQALVNLDKNADS